MIKDTLKIILKPEIQKLLDCFCSCFDIRTLFYSVSGEIMKVGLGKDDSCFCRLIQNRLFSPAKCIALDEQMRMECARRKEPFSYRCHAGIDEALVPIYVDNNLVGFAMIGQFRTTSEISGSLLRTWRKECGGTELEDAFRALPYYSPSKVKDILTLFSVMMDYAIAEEIVTLRGNFIINKIMSHIEQHIDRNVTLQEAAKVADKSTSTVSHTFKSMTGRTFKQNMLNAKFDKADEYFRIAPGLSVKEVAEKVGFDDPFYFSRIYKNYRKISPSQFQKRLESGAGRAR
jgi:AraC-like DNA-binding protein/ligand-binding sensor protein